MTGISSLAQALGQIGRIQEQQTLLDTLSTQLATGKKTQKFSGLDTDVIATQRARANLSSLETYVDNIKNAERRVQLTLTSIEEFKSQAKILADAVVGLTQESAHQRGEPIYYDDPLTPDVEENTIIGYTTAQPDIDLETLQDLAGNLYDYAADLLNSKDGDRYVLSGTDTSTPPFSDSGVLDSAISTRLASWKNGTISNDELIADLQDRTIDNGNVDALSDSVVGFSSSLSAGTAGKVTVRIDQRTEIDATVLGNDQGFRDIMVALSYMKSADLGPISDEVEIDPVTGLPNVITEGAPGANVDEQKENFYKVFNAVSTMINGALDDIDQQRYKLETANARIVGIKNTHLQDINILKTTVATIEDVDLNEVAVKLKTLQTQLEASFGVTARTSQLSLVNFL